ncbi:MAG: dihydrodipicolinate synthase family protein [Bryobacteraceae bacterium]
MRYQQAILVSCEIPWDENEQLLEDVFRQEVRHTLAAGFNNLYIFGTAGEGYAVDTPRFQRIVEVFHEETRGENIFPQVGVIGLSTANVLERVRFAYKVGFRAFQISLPSWGVLNDKEMMKFFVDVCGALPDCKFLNYNLMRTKRLLTAEDYRRIADEVPNLCATKNTGTTVATTRDLMKRVPEMQHFLGEGMFLYGCLYGECSILSSFGPMMPRKTKELFRLGLSGDFDKAFRFARQYLDMIEDVIAPMRAINLIDGAYDKALVRLGGLEAMPLRLLSPYESFSEEVYQECKRILHQKYSDWLG